jgi:hypothetical protein
VTDGAISSVTLRLPPYGSQILVVTTEPLVSVNGQPCEHYSYQLFQNYPNPFNPSTTVRYQIAGDSHVKLEIFNPLGEKVATLLDGRLPAGEYVSEWNGMNSYGQRASSGVYFIRLTASGLGSQPGQFTGLKKMVLLR